MAVAGRAARMGASSVLIEKGKMGGDCLNYGCVPSKALLAASRVADVVRGCGAFGVDVPAFTIDPAGVYRHVHDTMAALAPNDSVERFESFGVKIVQAPARFVGPREVEAGDYRISARHFVIATGCSPAVPPIPGLDMVPYYTNETIFDAGSIPDHLIIIGGGPTGVEMAQAHRNLGAKVTLLERFSILPRDDPELAEILRERLSRDGVNIRERVEIANIEKAANGVAVTFLENSGETRVEGSHILVATGRIANVDELDLETAGIDHTPKGIEVDNRLRTTNKKVFAVGDVAGEYQFAHMAGYHAKIVILNALLRWPAKVSTRAVPWVTYTSPELAQVGMTEEQANSRLTGACVLRWVLERNDRAHTDRQKDGLAKVITTRTGRVVGAGIAGTHAGELIHLWVLAVTRRMNVRALSSMIVPYPTFGYVNRYLADSFFTPYLYGNHMNKIFRFLARPS